VNVTPPMLQRPPKSPAKPPPSPGAVRARRSRALRRDGVVILRVRARRKRLVAAMRRANPDGGELETTTQIAAELQSILDAFITRWIGKI
jgi:hypothetical protein